MVDRRDLDWHGMYNVRDLGGLPTHDGSITRWGALVRSEGLDRLESEGWQALHGYRVRTCVDLRSGWEVTELPYEPGLIDINVTAAPLEDEHRRARRAQTPPR